MKKLHAVAVLAVVLLATAGIALALDAAKNFNSPAEGAQEVPSRDTLARGNAIYHLSPDGQSVSYKVIASNIDNVFMAHIHLAPAGVAGPIVVWLYPSTTPNVVGPPNSGRHDGILMQGTFTAANLTGPLAGHPLSDLVAQMRAGNTYTNVHTSNGTATLGPGNFPAGEIRGQIADNGPDK